MSKRKETTSKNRIYKNGLYYHPTKPGIVVAANPYDIPTGRINQVINNLPKRIK